MFVRAQRKGIEEGMCVGAKQYGAGSVKPFIYRDLQKLARLNRKFSIGMDAFTLLACLPQDNPLD